MADVQPLEVDVVVEAGELQQEALQALKTHQGETHQLGVGVQVHLAAHKGNNEDALYVVVDVAVKAAH